MAGSEQQGVEYSRDDLFIRAACLITASGRGKPELVELVEQFLAGPGLYGDPHDTHSA